jgi:hypothetical protein
MMDKHGCEVCGAKVAELRRGRCWGCYSAWAASRPVGMGACCVVCGERRRDTLKQVELLGAWVPTCHNCAARVHALQPLPRTLEGIRRRLDRERRRGDRRAGVVDTRTIPRERRGLERRNVGIVLDESDLMLLDDEMEIIGGDADPEPGASAETRIVQLMPASLRKVADADHGW